MAALEAEFPALLSERLHLRATDMQEVDYLYNLLHFSEVTRFTNWPDFPSKTQCLRSLRWMGEAFPKGKGCAWTIEDKNSGAILGYIRFNSIDRQSKIAELGYEMHPSSWGLGLMTEAVKAVTQCGFERFSLNRIEAWTLPGNPASDRVLENAGFQYEGTLRQKAWFKNAFHDFRMFSCIAGKV